MIRRTKQLQHKLCVIGIGRIRFARSPRACSSLRISETFRHPYWPGLRASARYPVPRRQSLIETKRHYWPCWIEADADVDHLHLGPYRFLPALRPSIDGYPRRRRAMSIPSSTTSWIFSRSSNAILRSASLTGSGRYRLEWKMDGRSACFRAAPVTLAKRGLRDRLSEPLPTSKIEEGRWPHVWLAACK